VKESSQGEYQEVRELIDRFNILADAREALSTKNEKTRDTIQMRQKRMQTDVLVKYTILSSFLVILMIIRFVKIFD
jgi:hypothetical protein